MTRILLLFEYPTLSGGERSMLAAIGGIREAGYEMVAVAPPSGPLADALVHQQIAVTPLEMCDSGGRRLTQQELRSRLRAVICELSPDLLHANSLSMSRPSGPVVAALGLPSIGHLRDIIGLSRAAVRDINCHTRLIAVSEATRQWHTAAGVDAAKMHVVYNGVDLSVFRPRRGTGFLHRELGLPPGAVLIGSIGQVGMRKGLDVLLEAARDVLSEISSAHFLIVGQRTSRKDEARRFEADLHRRALTPPLAGHIHWLGWRDDVHILLNELTLLVHAARQEPLGRVLLEAAASGTPVIATDVGGTREIIPPSYPVQPIRPDVANVLARSIGRVLSDPALRSLMSECLRHTAEQRFDVRATAVSLAGHYAELLGR